jgi:hypothetical protein
VAEFTACKKCGRKIERPVRESVVFNREIDVIKFEGCNINVPTVYCNDCAGQYLSAIISRNSALTSLLERVKRNYESVYDDTGVAPLAASIIREIHATLGENNDWEVCRG